MPDAEFQIAYDGEALSTGSPGIDEFSVTEENRVLQKVTRDEVGYFQTFGALLEQQDNYEGDHEGNFLIVTASLRAATNGSGSLLLHPYEGPQFIKLKPVACKVGHHVVHHDRATFAYADHQPHDRAALSKSRDYADWVFRGENVHCQPHKWPSEPAGQQ